MALYDRSSPADSMARGLGWFSIGLGAAELVAGRSLARWMGMEDKSALIRAYGLREITAGVGLLALGDPKPWIWGRVAGDAVDIATLASAVGDDNPRAGNARIALGAVMAATALDLVCAAKLHQEETAAWSPPPDYGDRSGFARPVDAMRGTASDAPIGDDMRTPKILQFQPAGQSQASSQPSRAF
ncbi:cyclase dehydrase [Azospirillum sp. TSO35-2]|uniref:cyclase dehydrase n=1 Tax=Azospirillum sp. TSO35-2 TaxID=716796 RepID=UPI000D6039CB|nr:cyclase dehydrase [Azospirillum sp. TSO35-2]PWC36121.1 cyclase dehydrase [Azospirillum sp. TSO35-2]